ncbi:MAG: glycosyltransferase family 2 protein [Sideroxydans sp.]|nr:glycosyltransferase family 2 protein [Sideroxydans sp.]
MSKFAHPKVSILIPVYNRENLIGECIESALAQTVSDIEVVVVDNASTDGTWKICQHYAVQDRRVRLFRNESNIGPVRNWIRCAQEAYGQYSKILFSDDLLEPRCIELMLQPFELPDVGLVFCPAKIGKTKEASVVVYSLGERALLSQHKYRDLILAGKVSVSPGAAMLRTADLKKNLHTSFPTSTPRPFERHGAGPDVMILLLTASQYLKVAYLEEPLVFFRNHAESFSAANTNNSVSESYISAIAYHLKNACGGKYWMRYLSGMWLVETIRAKRWVNPRLFLKTNEGEGSIKEILAGMLFVIRYIASKLIRKVITKQ